MRPNFDHVSCGREWEGGDGGKPMLEHFREGDIEMSGVVMLDYRGREECIETKMIA